MLELYVRLQTWLRSERAQDLIEYALIIALLVVVAAASLRVTGSGISHLYWEISEAVYDATSGDAFGGHPGHPW
jgi:hypothetical protein